MDRLIEKDNEKEKYVSCKFLEQGMICFSKGVRHCCGELPVDVDNLEIYDYDETFYEDIDKFISRFINRKKEIISLNRAGEKTICTGCLYLKEGYWDIEKKITNINFSFDSLCNFKCQYCYTVRNKKYKVDDDEKVRKVIDKIMNSAYINSDTKVTYASGEITIQKDVNRIIELIKDNDISFFSNATNYIEEIHKLIKRPNNSMIVSVDSGTRETFENIKGLNLFDRVWKNIARYASDGGNVIVKYIITDANSNKEDINGFIDRCVRNNIKHIRVTKDWLYKGDIVANGIMAASMQLMRKAMKNKIVVHNDGTTVI